MRVLKRLFMIAVITYGAVLGGLYLFQERLIFLPSKLDAGFEFKFNGNFEEINLNLDGVTLNGLHFRASKPKGAVLFLHGNAGALDSWGGYGQYFTQVGYDFYVFDYRGYGKSGGRITSEEQLYADTDAMMAYVMREFTPERISVVAYSIGSGLGARLANKWGVSRAVLLAAYYKFDELAVSKLPFVPRALVRYEIPTVRFLHDFSGEIILFHGRGDTLIEPSNSRRLAGENGWIKLHELDAGHNDILSSPQFWKTMKQIFSERI